jgi:hypothetical protein
VRVTADGPEGVCQALGDALRLTVASGYVTEIQRIWGVRARFPESWAGLACVVELDERLREVGR